MSRYWRTENEDGTFTNEKCYTPADMEAFWRWADANGWYYGELEEMWYNDDEELEALKIEDVLKLWEGEK